MHAVEAHDSGCGGQPEVALVVLYDGVNRVLREALLRLPISGDVWRGLRFCGKGADAETGQQNRPQRDAAQKPDRVFNGVHFLGSFKGPAAVLIPNSPKRRRTSPSP